MDLDDINRLALDTIYCTDDGREALVVFEGPANAPSSALFPLRNRDGAARIGYLPPDRVQRAIQETEYAWYAGSLTAVGPFDRAASNAVTHPDQPDTQPTAQP